MTQNGQDNAPEEKAAVLTSDSPVTVQDTESQDVAEPSRGKRAVVVVNQVPESDDEDGEGDEDIVDEEVEMKEWLADLPEDQDSVDLIHLKLQSSHVEMLDLPRIAKQLRKLCFRQNQITVLNPEIFGKLTNLEELDLYDNKVKDIGVGLSNLQNLESLDLSYNLIKHIPPTIKELKSLHTIYFVQNRITKIEGLADLGMTLRSLELGGNRIRKIEHLDALTNLEELWLGKNKIMRLEGLETLSRLKILSIQSNRITKLEGLDKLESLEEFYISHNGIKKIEGLEGNPKLRFLDVGNNFITEIENISHLTNLEELWASNNQIADMKPLDTQLAHIKTLETIYLEGNLCETNDRANYRRKVMLALPQVQQIDATFVRQV